MPDVRRLISKGRAVVAKGPATLRNIVYARLGIWPVGRIEDERLRDLPVYCISLKRAGERRELMQRQADAMGLTRFEFVDAVDASALDYEQLGRDGLYDDSAARKYHGRSIKLTEIAGSLSHASVYDLIVSRGEAMALVLEDDALFLTRRVNRFRLDHLPPDADIVFLNTFCESGGPTDRLDGELYDVGAYTGSAAAYLLTQEAARKLSVAARPVVHAADGFLGRVLPLPAGAKSHAFKQVGVTTQLRGYMIYPDCILNGSVCHYFGSYIPTGRNKAA